MHFSDYDVQKIHFVFMFQTAMMDEHLYTTKGPKPTVLWRPGNGRSIAKGRNPYQPFTHIVRTVHLYEALDVCVREKMYSKPILSLCGLNRKTLNQNHPCRKLLVLWFGTKYCPDDVKYRSNDNDEVVHDWYGNVQLAIPVQLLLERWRHYYLVEMMTAPTHSTTRILITNKDFSKVLPVYDPYCDGGPWKVNKNGHSEITDCHRYNNKGYNRHGHTLEFMLDVTAYGQKKLLEECEISFRNHSEAWDRTRRHVCHRFQKSSDQCPTPVTTANASRMFFQKHQELAQHSRIAKPALSNSAQYYLDCFLRMEGPTRSLVPAPAPGYEWPPLPHLQLAYINQQFSHFLFEMPGGLVSGNNHSKRFGFGMDGLEMVQQVSNLQYANWNSILARALRAKQRQREEENNRVVNYDQHGHQISYPGNQDYPGQFQLPWNGSHKPPLAPYWSQDQWGYPDSSVHDWNQNQPPGILQYLRNSGHPAAFQHSWG